MTGQLRHHDEESFIRCYLCGADAAGPCAQCRKSVCGSCCVLVQGAATQWAVCTRCDAGQDQVGGWAGLGLFFGKILFGLLLVIALLSWLAHLRG
jgi:hypothetical protein